MNFRLHLLSNSEESDKTIENLLHKLGLTSKHGLFWKSLNRFGENHAQIEEYFQKLVAASLDGS